MTYRKAEGGCDPLAVALHGCSQACVTPTISKTISKEVVMMAIDKRVLAALLGALLGGMLLAAVLVVGGVGAQSPETRGSVSGLTVSSDAPGALDVEWNEASPEPTDYRVSWARVEDSYVTWSDPSGNAYPTSESHSQEGLGEGARYKVKVRARYFETPESTSPLWSGPWSEEVTVTIKGQPPAAPTGLTASSVTHDGVTLTWTAPSSGTVTGYKVFRGADADSRSVIAEDTGSTDTTFTDSSVAAATRYVYSVLALSPDGDGIDSGIIIVNTPTDSEESADTSEQNSNDQLPEVEVIDAMAVTFRQPPSEHDASTPIDLTWDLSHMPVGVGWAIAADGVNGVLNVQGARYHRVGRVESGNNQSWNSRLTPHGYGDITITVNDTTNCSDENAVCDADGLMLVGGDQLVIRGPLGFTVSNAEVQEGPGATLDFVVSLNRPSDRTVTVSYTTEDGTATAGSDYTTTAGSITLVAGQSEQTVSVPVIEDPGDSGPEIVVLRLSSPADAILYGEYGIGTITELAVSSQEAETGTAPSVSVGDTVAQEGPGATLDYVVSLSHASDQPVTATYKTVREKGRGAPRPEWDYHAASGSIAFATGETEKTVTVWLKEDEEEDGREIVKLTLVSVVGATIADALGEGTILNTPNGARGRARYSNHDRPDWNPGQIFPASIISAEDHTIDLAWTAPLSYTAHRYRINYAQVDPEIANSSFPWEGADHGNHWVDEPSATSTRITGLTGGVEYKVRVQGQFPAEGTSPAWNGPWSQIMKLTVAGDGDPPAPLATTSEETTTVDVLIPAVIPDAVDAEIPAQYASGQLATMRLESPMAGDIGVSWTAPSLPADQTPSAYQVNWAKDQESYPDSSAATGFVEVTGTAHTLTGVEDGQTYRVRVRALYAQGLYTAWNGPWTELEIVTATADTTFTLTTILVTDSDGELETATQSSVSTRTLSTEATAIPHDGTSFDTYISRVWVVAQHDAVQLSWKRPTDDVGYRFWRAPAGDSAYTELVEIEDSTLIRQPKNGLSSRFYYSDTTVTAATEYKYAVQVLDSGDYSTPYEALASTTEWLPTQERTTRIVQPIPTNEEGDFMLEVGEKVKATVFLTSDSTNYILTLKEGEAYRVELYDLFANDSGHSHRVDGDNNYAGPIGIDQAHNRITAPHGHGHHISLGSITQVATGDSILFESDEYDSPRDADWRVFWHGDLLKSCCDSGDLSYVFHAPAAGEYKVRVRADFGPIQYGVKVTRLGDQPDIPSFRQRHGFYTVGGTTWGHNAAALGNIGVDDKDWFAVKLESGKSYRVSLAAGGNLDWQGLANARLFSMAGPDGVQVQPDFAGSSRDRFRLNVPQDEGGYYHFGVSGASASDRGLYVLSIVEDDFPTNPNAPVVSVGQQFIGMIESGSDVDWIGAELTANRTYRIQASGSRGDIRGRAFARVISVGSNVYDKDGQRVQAGNAFSKETMSNHAGYITGRIESAKFSVTTSGLYFFEVRGSQADGRKRGAYYFVITDITP